MDCEIDSLGISIKPVSATLWGKSLVDLLLLDIITLGIKKIANQKLLTRYSFFGGNKSFINLLFYFCVTDMI